MRRIIVLMVTPKPDKCAHFQVPSSVYHAMFSLFKLIQFVSFSQKSFHSTFQIIQIFRMRKRRLNAPNKVKNPLIHRIFTELIDQGQ